MHLDQDKVNNHNKTALSKRRYTRVIFSPFWDRHYWLAEYRVHESVLVSECKGVIEGNTPICKDIRHI